MINAVRFNRMNRVYSVIMKVEYVVFHLLAENCHIQVTEQWTYLLIRQLCSVNTAKRAFTDQIVSIEALCCYLQVCHCVSSCPDGGEVHFLHDRLVSGIIFIGLVQLDFRRRFQVHRDILLQFFSSWWEWDRADGPQLWTETIVKRLQTTPGWCVDCWTY